MAEPFVLVPAPDPMIGRKIDRFVVIAPLGRGGMGAVYLAQHEGAAHIRCVIKTMLAHLASNAMMISRFKTETEAVSRLKHDNIVKLENFGVLDDGQMFMRFEFIEGKPLDRYLGEHGGRLSLHRAAYLAFQVCDALDHAHAVGVVHRDLKPDNLLIVVDLAARVPQLVKIVDFGISKIVRTGEVQTGSGMSMGTPYFMAVEQYANAAEATSRSDVFSLGVILWLMLTGEMPWGRPDPNVLYHLQRTVVPTRPPEDVMPGAVTTILLRCLSVTPEDRPTMRELGLELASVIPATDRAPSGNEILMDLVPRWLVSAPDHVRTARHPSVRSDRVAAQLWPQIETDAARQDGREGRSPPPNVITRSPSVPALEPVHAADSRPWMSAPAPEQAGSNSTPPTAQGRPRALALPDAPGAGAALFSPGSAREPSPPAPPQAAAVHERPRPPTPLVAALPTGLVSQKFAAQEPPVDGRVPSIVVASEILLAGGTPGPQPYAHAELPAVLVSTTQLSAPSARQPGHTESPPLIVLPDARPTLPLDAPSPRPALRKILLFGGAGCVLAALASFGLTRLGTRAIADEDVGGPRSARGTGSSVMVAATDGEAVPPSSRRPVEASTDHVADAAGSAPTPNTRETSPEPPAQRPMAPTDAGPTMVAISADSAAPAASGKESDHPPAPKHPIDTHAPANAIPEPAHRSAAPQPAPAPKTPRTPQLVPAEGKKTGKLTILVTPWALVWLNGKPLDQTPCVLDDVPAGRYRLRLKNDVAGKDETMTITVTPTQTTTIERTW